MTRGVLAATAGLAALSLVAGCTPPHPHPRSHDLQPVSALDCPAEEGDLELQSGGSGQSQCVYSTDGGGQVTLRLVSLADGGAQAALAPVEARLKAEVPTAASAPATPAPPGSPPPEPGAQAQAGGDHERFDLDVPGLHIHTHGDGHADVDTVGVHVHADDHEGGGAAKVDVGDGVQIDAHDGAAQIRINEKGSGIRLSYILASDAPGPHGYRVGAYEARGPSSGPLVVAEILGKDKDSDDLRHDARHLLKLNAGD